jgi:hypothetical protein
MDSCKHGNEPLGSIKDEELIVQLSDFSVSEEGFCCIQLAAGEVWDMW